MDRAHVIRRGLDIPIAGRASGAVVSLDPPPTVAYQPLEFRGATLRPAVREGDTVARGAPILFEKGHREMVLRSPVAGRVAEIRRGARRVLTDLVIATEGEADAPMPAHTLASIAAMSREQALAAAVQSGYWPALRTRPLGRVPDPATPPERIQSVLVAAMESGPLMPDADVLLGPDDAEPLQAAVALLSKIAPTVRIACRGPHPALDKLQGVERHTFDGPHPAGDPTVQVNLLDPPRGTNQVWTIRAWDAVSLGRTLLEGRFSSERTIAAVGAGLVAPRLVRTVLGAPIRHVIGEVVPGEHRYVLGSVLTGTAVAPDRWTSFGARAVHVLPETVERSILGWALPMLGTWSFHSAFLKGILSRLGGGAPSGIDMRPGLYGGVRTILPVGVYERVIATPEIVPEFLFKALSAGDLEESLRLGLLDLSEEEAALCTYVCPSKIQIDALLRQGLDAYEKEAG